MRIKCLSSNRDLITQIIQKETGSIIIKELSPSFNYIIGPYTITRDSFIISEDPLKIFPLLSSLGLCDYPYEIKEETNNFTYSTDEHNGQSLTNLFCLISSHQHLLNKVVQKRNFHIDKKLMKAMLSHQPETLYEFMQLLYFYPNSYSGITLNKNNITFTGFTDSPIPEHIVRQYTDQLIGLSFQKKHIKAFTRNIRNRKYAMRTWLNALGFIGDDYAELRYYFTKDLDGNCAEKIGIEIATNTAQ